MAAGGPFPNKNSDFNNYTDTCVPYLNTNQVRLQITNDSLNALNLLYDHGGVAESDLGWKQLWVPYANPDKVTKSIRTIVKTRRAQLEAKFRLIYNDIPKSALNINDRTTLNLPERDSTPTGINPPGYAPVPTIDTIGKGFHIIRFADPTNPESQALPYGCSIVLQWFVGAPGLDVSAIAFTNDLRTGRFLEQVDFTLAEKNKTAYYRCCYETERGERSTFSDVLDEVIA